MDYDRMPALLDNPIGGVCKKKRQRAEDVNMPQLERKLEEKGKSAVVSSTESDGLRNKVSSRVVSQIKWGKGEMG